MPLDLDVQVRVTGEHALDVVERRAGDLDELLRRTARVLRRSLLAGAVVEPIDDAVTVAILVGAPVVLLGTRLVRATVLRVEDPVAVVVGIRATVLVLEA